MKFLIIEDNERLADLIQQSLEEQGYPSDITTSGREGEELALRNGYDVIVLDLMLPDADGLQVCRNIRRRGVTTPVLMLTALSATTDKVAGLDAGADDYLAKPFDFDEFLARSRALLRRAQSSEGRYLRFGDIEMDLVGRKVTRGGQMVELTTKEFALLEYFLRNPERVLTRTNIGERVWDLLFHDGSNVIEVYVSRLRNKIAPPFEVPLIQTVVGTGYVLSTERNLPPTA